MNASIQSLKDYLKSLKTLKRFIQVEKLGLCETTLNNIPTFPQEGVVFGLQMLSFYTKEPKLIFSINNEANAQGEPSSSLHLSLINTMLLQNTGTIEPEACNNLCLNLNGLEMSFTKIVMKTSKYLVLSLAKSNVVVLGQFTAGTKSSLIKLFLLFISNAYYNFLDSKASLKSDLKANSTVNTKLFELFICKPIAKHFERTVKSLFKRSDMKFVNIDYKDLYLVDLSTAAVLFNWSSIAPMNELLPKKQLNELVWNELMFHCLKLRDDYAKSNSSQFDSIDYSNYFVKVAYTASYPRAIFVLKFLPVLKGLGLIHVYTQNKLSNENTKQHYREFDIIYGHEMNRESGQVEYRYKEPQRLKEIEVFFIEFLMSRDSSLDFFNYPQYDLKYFDESIMSIIDKVMAKENISSGGGLDRALSRITSSLYDEYLRQRDRPKEMNANSSYLHSGKNHLVKEEENYPEDNESSIQKLNSNQWNLFGNEKEQQSLFQIKTFFFFNEVFAVVNPELKQEDMTILLSKQGDRSVQEDSKNASIHQLINHDISLLSRSRCKEEKDGYQLEESLFNIDMTAIAAKRLEEFKQHKECRSENLSSKKKLCDKVNKTEIAVKEDLNLDFSNQSNSSDNISRFNHNSESANDNNNNDEDTDRKSLSNNIINPMKANNQTNPTYKPMLSTTGNKL